MEMRTFGIDLAGTKFLLTAWPQIGSSKKRILTKLGKGCGLWVIVAFAATRLS